MLPFFPDAIQNWDVSVLNWIQDTLVNPVLDVFFVIITHLGDAGFVWIVLAVVLAIIKKTRKTGIMMGVALLIGVIFGNLIMKNVFGRVRPFDLEGAYGSIMSVDDLLVSRPGDKSFPSGHTLASFEAAFVLIIRHFRFGIPAIVLAALVAFSRLYLYLHFPTDVIAGTILAFIDAVVAITIVNMLYKYNENKKKLKLNE